MQILYCDACKLKINDNATVLRVKTGLLRANHVEVHACEGCAAELSRWLTETPKPAKPKLRRVGR